MRNFAGRRFRLGVIIAAVSGVLSALIVVSSLAANSVDTSLSDADRDVIEGLDINDVCGEMHGFDDQLNCIQRGQAVMDGTYPDTNDSFEKGITSHELSDFHERGFGPCYDRALLLEKLFAYYGLETRRVAIYEKQRFPWDYLMPGIRSHALSEVNTERGWMVVDSVSPVVGVDEEGEVYSIRDIRDGMQNGEVDDETFGVAVPGDFFDGQFAFAYGVYSRHGHFFDPHLPVPEVKWTDFRLW